MVIIMVIIMAFIMIIMVIITVIMVIITVIMVIITVTMVIIMVIITVTMVIIMVECLGISLEGKNFFGPDLKFSDFEPGCGPKTFFKFHENQTNRLQDIDGGRAKKRNVFYPHPL